MPRTMKRTTPIEHALYADPVQWPLPPLFTALRTHAHCERLIRVDLYFTPAASPCFMFCTEPCLDEEDPVIVVDTPGRVCNIPVEEDAEHAIALAHELGHHESWLREETSAEFEELMMTEPRAIYDRTHTLSHALLDELVEDEKRAWTYGREILRVAVPAFDAWERYDAKAGDGVAGYEKAVRDAKAKAKASEQA